MNLHLHGTAPPHGQTAVADRGPLLPEIWLAVIEQLGAFGHRRQGAGRVDGSWTGGFLDYSFSRFHYGVIPHEDLNDGMEGSLLRSAADLGTI